MNEKFNILCMHIAGNKYNEKQSKSKKISNSYEINHKN